MKQYTRVRMREITEIGGSVKIQKGLEKLPGKEINEYFTADIKEKRVTILGEKPDKLESFQKVLEELNDEEKRINMIDPDAPIMAHKDGQKLPGYFHQTGKDGKCGIATAVQSTQNNDIPEDLLLIVG